MDRTSVENQLAIDEGKRLTVYLDSLGKPTVGIGHLVLMSDNLQVGNTITEAQCDQFFQDDLNHAIAHAEILFPNLPTYPEAVQESVVNMTYNLGQAGLAKFPKFCAAIKAQDWAGAVAQLTGTLWQKQVGPRADRIIAAIASCEDDPEETIQPA